MAVLLPRRRSGGGGGSRPRAARGVPGLHPGRHPRRLPRSRERPRHHRGGPLQRRPTALFGLWCRRRGGLARPEPGPFRRHGRHGRGRGLRLHLGPGTPGSALDAQFGLRVAAPLEPRALALAPHARSAPFRHSCDARGWPRSLPLRGRVVVGAYLRRVTNTVVLRVLLFTAIFSMAAVPPLDPDLWWHLANGRLMLATSSIPHVDVYSFSAAGHPWVMHEWLADLAMYLLFQAGGLPWLVAVFAGVVTASAICLYLLLRRTGLPSSAAVVLTLVGAASVAQRAVLRPAPARADRVPGGPAARVDVAALHLALGEPPFGVSGGGHHQRALRGRRSGRCLAIAGGRHAAAPADGARVGNRSGITAVGHQPVRHPDHPLFARHSDVAADPEQHPGMGLAGLPLASRAARRRDDLSASCRARDRTRQGPHQ